MQSTNGNGWKTEISDSILSRLMKNIKIFKEENDNPTIRLIMAKPKKTFYSLESMKRITRKDPQYKFTTKSVNFNNCLGMDFPGCGWYETDEALAKISIHDKGLEITIWKKEGIDYVGKSLVKLLRRAKWVFIYA